MSAAPQPPHDEQDRHAAPERSRTYRSRRRFLIGTLVLGAPLLLFLGVAGWVLLTTTGTRWAIQVAADRMPALSIDETEGSLWRGITVSDVSYAPADGPRVRIDRASLQLDPGALFRGAVHVEQLAVRGVRVRLRPSTPKEDEQPFSLQPPIDVMVEDAVVHDAAVANESGPLARVRVARLQGAWTDNALVVKTLDVRAAEGTVQAQGRVSGGPEAYQATLDGQWRWDVGGKTYAGSLHTVPTEQPAMLRVVVRLAAPVAAQVSAQVHQAPTLAWTAQIEVPSFDPRRSLLSGSNISQLAADLAVRGTSTEVSVTGRVSVDAHVIRLEALRLEQPRPQLIVLDSLTAHLDDQPGRVTASGRVDLEPTPARATLQARWEQLRLPEAWVGQPLLSRGALQFSGSTVAYRSSGTVALGPPGRLADIRFEFEGTPEQLQLERLEVRQESGSLAVSGKVTDLSQSRRWQLEATARDFDPGDFLVGWPGDLDLSLTTEGFFAPTGPHATVDLQRLGGQLRGRAVSGHGRMKYAPPLSLAGELTLRSGRSRVHLRAEPGEALDAAARFQVASLADFLPSASGRITGDLRGRGKWPDLRIVGNVSGTGLTLAGASVGRFDTSVDLRNPKSPSGQLQLDAKQVGVAGYEFGGVALRAHGSPAEHELTLAASGSPLSLRSRVTGSLAAEGTWRGHIERLGIELGDTAELQLAARAPLAYEAGAVDLGRTCLEDGSIRLCGDAQTKPDGALHLDYLLEAVPLHLATILAPDALPGQLHGIAEGRGSVRRTSGGQWFGEATLVSASGRLDWGTAGPGSLAGSSQQLYEQLVVKAELRGSRASGSLSAGVAGDGRVRGAVTLAGLDEGAARIDGTLEATLPTLAPYAALVPQVAGLDGRVAADLHIAGSTASPRISGTALVTSLAGEIPVLGIELSQGELRATSSRNGGTLDLLGSIRSGKGRLQLQGSAERDGTVDLTITGRNFLAADLPGARVVATPDLIFNRDDAGMKLEGTVRVPEASLDISKLPRGTVGAREVSSDVVIVNGPVRDEPVDAGSALPLSATVRVILGDDVTVTGFGLDTTLEGELTVRESPGQDPTASGEVQIDGTYKAYGQDLEITQGRVLYAGSPLDNPNLDIRAVRQIEDITAGLQVTGPAQSPRVNVFSDPSLGETDALAYLVAGRPLQDIGAGGDQEGDLLQEASQSLGTAAGGLLAKSIGERLGIDEVGIAESEIVGGAALTLGQYLSPRLYVGFGVGLFDPGQVVTIRYKLSDAIAVRAATGEDTTQAGVEYRIEN